MEKVKLKIVENLHEMVIPFTFINFFTSDIDKDNIYLSIFSCIFSVYLLAFFS